MCVSMNTMKEVDCVDQNWTECVPLDEVLVEQLGVHQPQEVGRNQTHGK